MRLVKTNSEERYQLSESECRKLITHADVALENTYPKSGHGYAVAVMTKSGADS